MTTETPRLRVAQIGPRSWAIVDDTKRGRAHYVATWFTSRAAAAAHLERV